MTTSTDIKNGVQRLTKLPIRRLCEHNKGTGALEMPLLVVTLAAASLPVAVVNPRDVRDFARSAGQLAKSRTSVKWYVR